MRGGRDGGRHYRGRGKREKENIEEGGRGNREEEEVKEGREIKGKTI